MKARSRLITRLWMLPMGAVILIAAHVLVLRYAFPHKDLSVAVVAGVMILMTV